MQEAYRALLSVHVALGSVALLAFWIALLSTKGSRRHRDGGRVFVWTMTAAVMTALPLCLAVQVFDPFVIRPPEAGTSAADLAVYPQFIRGLFRGLAGVGAFALASLALAMRALKRGQIVKHVAWILSAGAVGHGAFLISVVPKLLPDIYDRNPTHNPLPWLLPVVAGAAAVLWGRRWASRRYPAQREPAATSREASLLARSAA